MASRSSDRRRPSLRVVSGPAAVLAALAFSWASADARQPASAAQADPARRAAERIRALQKEAEALVSQESVVLAQLRKLEVDRQLEAEKLAQADRERADVERQLAAASARAASLRATADAERPEIEGRLVRVYKLGQSGFWRLLLDIDDLRSASRAYRTAAALTRIDRDRVIEHQRTLDALAKQEQELQARVKRIAELQAASAAAKAAIDRAVQARTALVAQIDARRDLNAQLTGELQAAQQRLQASVAQLNAGAPAPVLPLKAFQGALPWPARGRLLVRFGRQPSSRFGTEVVRNGIEVGVPEGEAVRAVHEGTVAYAEPFTGYGNLVIVEHGDRTVLADGFLSDVQVSKGERVEAQGTVGTSGTDPNGNPALYFELRVDGKAVDPLQWLVR